MKIEAFERGARKYCQVMELDPDEILKPRNRLALQQLITP